MLEVMNSDYIRTARAKGLSEHTVIYKHAFRNTLIPLVTTLSGTLPGLFGGAMITETVFAIPGIGYTALRATIQGDIPFIMGYNMFRCDQQFRGGDGIVTKGVENTIENIGRIGRLGMRETDKEIIRIMTGQRD